MNVFYKIQTVQTHIATRVEDENGDWYEDGVKKLEEPIVSRVGEVELLGDAIVLANHVRREIIEDNEGTSEAAVPVVKVIKCTVFEEEVDLSKQEDDF